MRSFGVILGRNSKIFKPGQIIYRKEALGSVGKRTWFLRSTEIIPPEIRGIWGQNPYILKSGQLIYQNGALGHMVRKKSFSPEVTCPKTGVFRGF